MEAVRDISTRAQQTGLVRALPQPEETHALVPVADPGSPLPVFSGEQMAEAFRAYRQLQVTLDTAMPDAIMRIQGRAFRKKAYWRAVRTAFNLDVTMVEEHREVLPDGNWGWLVTYRAKAPNGRAADGDGACYASEKPGRGQATEHNVRSHAHTRAFNRAVSNLVGFGEVSAEEAEREERPRQAPPQQPRAVGASSTVEGCISEAQQKRLFAIAREHSWVPDELKAWLHAEYGLDSSSKIKRGQQYEEICARIASDSEPPVDREDGGLDDEEPRDAF
jgi:hypothetical protein